MPKKGTFHGTVHPPNEIADFPWADLIEDDRHLGGKQQSNYMTGFGGEGFDGHFTVTLLKGGSLDNNVMWVFPRPMAEMVKQWREIGKNEKEDEIRGKVSDALYALGLKKD